MEQIYALGVTCIEFIQDWFEDYENFFENVNDISNPHYALEIIFPLVSIVDSVFAAQFLLCTAFGSWMNAIMKWVFLEERPYWWVHETTFYAGMDHPNLRQFRQTCETGPGCPSGHTTNVAMELLLVVMWLAHFMNDRKCYIWWWKLVAYPLLAFALGSVMLARMFVAAHFPHQCLLGALVGLFLAPALCIYISDPYIWGATSNAKSALRWHIALALSTVVISGLTYWSLKLCGIDPQWSIKLAHRYCEEPENIHVATTPLFALVQSTASLLGWAVVVTPHIAKYRHYTQRRSLLIAAFATVVFAYATREFQSRIDRERAWCFYLMQFVIYAVKPLLFLRLSPALAVWPYSSGDKTKMQSILKLDVKLD